MQNEHQLESNLTSVSIIDSDRDYCVESRIWADTQLGLFDRQGHYICKLPSFQSFSFRELIGHDLFEIVKQENNDDTSLFTVGAHPILFPMPIHTFRLSHY